jgi:hypothetical protein
VKCEYLCDREYRVDDTLENESVGVEIDIEGENKVKVGLIIYIGRRVYIIWT